MAAFQRLLLVVLLAAGIVAPVAAAGATANPIRKVVTMLQNMQGKIADEVKKEQKLHDAAMCGCQTGKTDLETSIADGKARVEAITAALKSGSSALTGLQAQLAEHQASRDEAKASIATATSIREKEAAAFAKTKSDTEQNLAALSKAVGALEQGAGGSFIQTGAASVLKTFAMEKSVMADASRQELLAFLSGTQDEEYAPASGEITGILKQMGDQMTESLSEATAAEEAAIKSFEGLTSSKTNEIDTLQAQIEEELLRVGEAGVGGAGGENALDDAKEGVKDDSALLAQLESSCATRTKEFEEAEKLRSDENLALADTIKLLNSDETLELFKKALPSASSSFLQVTVSSAAMKSRALAVLRGMPRRHLQVDFIALALQGKQMGFDKVIGMIDDMVATLNTEQGDDDSKKNYCNTEFDKSDDQKKAHELSISDSETAIDELKGSIAETVEETKTLEAGIKKLDKSVAEATEQRKAENADYKELTTNNALAKEVLLFAKNRLNKFYNPSLATLLQTSRKQEGGGVIAMIDLLVKDLDKETQEAEVTENHAQKNFEQTIDASKNKRAEDSSAVTNHAAGKAQKEEALDTEAGNQFETKKALMQTGEYIMNLHKECDWLLKNYDARKEARSAEIEAIGKAKAVLSGADYSLVQTGRSARARLHR